MGSREGFWGSWLAPWAEQVAPGLWVLKPQLGAEPA